MSRAPSRASSYGDASGAATTANNAALLGAATAFSRPPLHSRTTSTTSYRSTSGGQSRANLSASRSKSPISPDGNAQGYFDFEHKENVRTGSFEGPRLEPPAQPGRGHTKSPSLYAASVAASRAPPAAMMGKPASDGRARARTVQRPSAPPKPRRLSQHFSRSEADNNDKPTDDTSIPPTTSLVKLFERKASLSQLGSAQRPPPEPIVIAPSPDLPLNSPKPVRSSGAITTMFHLELDGSNDRRIRKESLPDVSPRAKSPMPAKNSLESSEPKIWDPNTRTFRPQSEVDRFKRDMSAARREDERRSSGGAPQSYQSGASRGASPVFERTRALTPSNRSPDVLKSPRFSVDEARPRTASLKSTTTDPVKIQRPPVETRFDGHGDHSPSSFQSAASVTAQYHQLYPKKLTSSMTGDQLANAMVASSLASSRTNSPRPQSRLEPPPPPTRRHRHKLSFSRTPSPTAKTGMLQTLRKVESDSSEGSEDDLHPYSKHKKEKHRLVRKHPNKHHEGDRKRWREAVTERERKRYEGLWAANKGLHFSYTAGEQKVMRKDPNASSVQDLQVSVQDQVSNLVAREVWSRSRLSVDTLAMVWDLVDSGSVGRLSKEEFVVGLWLIDQRLKGRKLPIKVSDSVWASVRGLRGIKIRKSIN